MSPYSIKTLQLSSKHSILVMPSIQLAINILVNTSATYDYIW
ncbi:7762_t:CDS:1, partial [Dentiscutata heterogama]